MRHQMERMQAMATLGELTGTATHEFNNVLMTIMNYAKLGLRNVDLESREKALQKILDASVRASQISNTILAQARNRTDSKEPTDLPKLVDETLVLMQREMQKYRVSLEKDYASDLVPVLASGNAIQSLLLNLITNARQAMPDGGTLLIRLQAREMDERSGVELTIRDSGLGIAPDVLPRIFDPYFSTKSGPDESGKGGTGIGLAACKKIVDGHGGRIRVESSVGRGTAFVITLPGVAADRADAA
ncbi:MAG: ATP-binding protein [Planctomycetota bacterium]